MPEVLIIKDFGRPEQRAQWQNALQSSELAVRHWDAPGEKSEIDYALVWRPAPGALAEFPNLKVIFSMAAGLDHLRGRGVLPPGIPVVRMVEDTLTAGMTEYVLYQVLRFHRDMHNYELDSRARTWTMRPQRLASERRVGIMGLGVLGGAAARALVSLGFDVAGWSRSEKNLDGVVSFFGVAQLAEFLRRSEILVCLLPLTRETEGILNADSFAQLPRGAYIINAARGAHCDEAALLAALDSQHLGGAALDVFAQEPLPPTSPLWQHPKVSITPHIASATLPESSAQHVRDNIARFRVGKPLTHQVDFARGY